MMWTFYTKQEQWVNFLIWCLMVPRIPAKMSLTLKSFEYRQGWQKHDKSSYVNWIPARFCHSYIVPQYRQQEISCTSPIFYNHFINGLEES